jgi:hypothetical protein
MAMADTLTEKTCTPCKGGVPPLTWEEARRYQGQAPSWELRDETRRIERTFKFKNFGEALRFVQQVGELAEAEGHHPDVSFAGATPRSACRPRRSRDCTKTTSFWRPRSIGCRRRHRAPVGAHQR